MNGLSTYKFHLGKNYFTHLVKEFSADRWIDSTREEVLGLESLFNKCFLEETYNGNNIS